MTQNEFMRQQQAAVERMREMNARAHIGNNTSHKMPPAPSFVRVNENRNNNTTAPLNPERFEGQSSPKKQTVQPHSFNTQHQPQKINSGGLNIPFLDSILRDSDSTLIIGLLLILMSENSDKMLLFALIYILL